MYTNDKGKEIEINKTIKVRNEWNGKGKIEIEQFIQRYIPYEEEGKKKVILQTMVKTGLEKNNIPVKETKIEIKVPEIEGKRPEEVKVYANTTKASNGKEGYEFNERNWEYEKEKGIIRIKVENEIKENKVSWEKESKDEYVITYKYSKEEEKEEIEASQEVRVEIEAYNNEETKVESIGIGKIEIKEKIGEIINSRIEGEKEINKGYLYNEREKEIEYKTKTIVEIGYAEIIEKIEIKTEEDKYEKDNGEEEETRARYKSSRIKKEMLEKILGEEGYIEMKDTINMNMKKKCKK